MTGLIYNRERLSFGLLKSLAYATPCVLTTHSVSVTISLVLNACDTVKMNNKTVRNDDLPDDWIKRPSKSRPDRFYYYNTLTKQSQWTSPVSPGATRQKSSKDKRLAESPKGSDVKIFKISSSSKQSEKMTCLCNVFALT